ncbi:MAG: LamG domain-containing protein, partial [bacterium]
GMAIELDGNSAIIIDHADDLSLQTYTLLAWVNIPNPPTDWWTVVAKDGWPNRNYGMWLASGTALLHNSFTSGGAPDNNFVNAVTPIEIKKWQHVAATYDMKEGKVFINGKLDAKSPFSSKPNVTDVPVIIGRTPTNTYKYSGAVDEVAIFNKALSEDEINKIMTEGLKNTVAAVNAKSKLAITWASVKR